MRGIGNTQLFGDPGVGLYIDGVFHKGCFLLFFLSLRLESIEVLKGPKASNLVKTPPAV